jgi:DNA polymerase III subunit epsilon
MEFIEPNLEYVAFDLETTGLTARIDRVVEIAAVRFTASGQVVDRFEQLVNPQRPMSPAAQAVNGISDADLAGAPVAREVLPRFLAFLGDPQATSMVAHNASFDAGFLGSELSRAGYQTPQHRIFDTLALARRRHPELASYRLASLAARFGLPEERMHRALTDSLCVMKLWLALEGPVTPLPMLVSYPIHDPRDSVAAPHGWHALDHAIALGEAVRIQYLGGSRGTSPREVTPRRYLQKGGETYLVAYCHLDCLEKSFRLDRIQACESFPVERAFDRHVDPEPPNR